MDRLNTSSSPPSDTEIVLVPVPVKYLPAVYGALAAAMENERAMTAIPAPVSQETIPPTGRVDWTNAANVQRLRDAVTSPGATALLDLTAERPGHWVSFAEVVKRAADSHGRTYEQVRADARVLTRIIRRVSDCSLEDAVWPVEFGWNIDGDSQRSYRMTEEVARLWQATGSN